MGDPTITRQLNWRSLLFHRLHGSGPTCSHRYFTLLPSRLSTNGPDVQGAQRPRPDDDSFLHRKLWQPRFDRRLREPNFDEQPLLDLVMPHAEQVERTPAIVLLCNRARF